MEKAQLLRDWDRALQAKALVSHESEGQFNATGNMHKYVPSREETVPQQEQDWE